MVIGNLVPGWGVFLYQMLQEEKVKGIYINGHRLIKFAVYNELKITTFQEKICYINTHGQLKVTGLI